MSRHDDSIKRQIENIKWFHRIDLGNGLVTNGVDDSPSKLKTLKITSEMIKNKTVLDIGAWDGFFSFEAEKMGASQVTAVDPYMWNEKQWGSKKGFTLAKNILKSNVKDKNISDMMEINTLGAFDVVLFLGVLYHLKDPLVILEKVASVTRELLVLETELDMRVKDFPFMAYNHDKQIFEDYTNYWIPNRLAVETILSDVGFKKIEMVHMSDTIWRLGRAALNRGKSKLPFKDRTKLVRAVFYARK